MKVYCVFGIEYHVRSELIGIYDSLELAEKRKTSVNSYGFDEIRIEEFELNKDFE